MDDCGAVGLPVPSLDSTLGALLIGLVVAAIFFGITSIQVFLFFEHPHRADGTAFKWLIFFLWILDALHLALCIHGCYYYMVSNYSNPTVLTRITWSILAQVIVSKISEASILLVFLRRIWALSRTRSKGLAIALSSGIFVFVQVVLVCGFVFAIKPFARGRLEISAIGHDNDLVYNISIAGEILSAVGIAGTLIVLLCKSRTSFSSTKTVLNLLIVYAINTCLLTTVWAIACFATFAIWPSEFIYIGLYFSLGKLYFNSLLANLNGRSHLQHKMMNSENEAIHIHMDDPEDAKSTRQTESTLTQSGNFRASFFEQ